MAAGYLLRAERAFEERGNKPCEQCGHTHSHFEYAGKWVIEDGEMVWQQHPKYKPALFHCVIEGCDCEKQL